MKVLRFNVSKPRKWTKDGVEKTAWDTIGTYTEFHKDDGSIGRKLEIPAIGLDAPVFPIEKKDDPARPASFPRQSQDVTQEENPF